MRHYALYAALLLSSCRGSRIDPEPTRTPTETRQNVDSSPETGIASTRKEDSSPPKQGELTPPAPDAPRWQQRQYRKNLRALPPTVPKKLAKGASFQQATGDNIQQQSGYKPAAPQAQAMDSATVQVATAAKNGQAASGKGNVLEKVEPVKPSFWQRVTAGLAAIPATLGWFALAAGLLHAFGPGIGYGMGWARRLV